ncbi:hypothetical protein HN587_06380 [Candidatus Woesearchaeota archaeon]|jgi:hypothetical protein|nr:hypothetical protein [Candidatus Woesearchaeota archaeon]
MAGTKQKFSTISSTVLILVGFAVLFTVLMIVMFGENPEFVSGIELSKAEHSYNFDNETNKTIDVLELKVSNTNDFLVNCDLILKITGGEEDLTDSQGFLMYPWTLANKSFSFEMPNGNSSINIYSECVRLG